MYPLSLSPACVAAKRQVENRLAFEVRLVVCSFLFGALERDTFYLCVCVYLCVFFLSSLTQSPALRGVGGTRHSLLICATTWVCGGKLGRSRPPDIAPPSPISLLVFIT